MLTRWRAGFYRRRQVDLDGTLPRTEEAAAERRSIGFTISGSFGGDMPLTTTPSRAVRRSCRQRLVAVGLELLRLAETACLACKTGAW
jgi:hypothetical protein